MLDIHNIEQLLQRGREIIKDKEIAGAGAKELWEKSFHLFTQCLKEKSLSLADINEKAQFLLSTFKADKDEFWRLQAKAEQEFYKLKGQKSGEFYESFISKHLSLYIDENLQKIYADDEEKLRLLKTNLDDSFKDIQAFTEFRSHSNVLGELNVPDIFRSFQDCDENAELKFYMDKRKKQAVIISFVVNEFNELFSHPKKYEKELESFIDTLSFVLSDIEGFFGLEDSEYAKYLDDEKMRQIYDFQAYELMIAIWLYFMAGFLPCISYEANFLRLNDKNELKPDTNYSFNARFALYPNARAERINGNLRF